ncbi:MAG: IclR family transcriptional regulator C-terminal domain-containing protein [Ancalomicrobiaceae bacterium]|nr:IclR family transcriptional regulator C-terminal domain-containing protein [Ancalomicrobiaceae bacterium]
MSETGPERDGLGRAETAHPALGEGHPDFVAGLAKGLKLIECFDDEHETLTVSQAAEAAGLSRASARRCLITLEHLGYVMSDAGRYRLGIRTLGLGAAYLVATPLPQLVQPFLEILGERVQESCSVSILEGTDIVYVARSARRRIMSVGIGVGTRLPAYCTSMGRVLLAALPPGEARQRLEASDRRRLTQTTVTGLGDLTTILAEVRDRGYCISNQELEVGLVSVAVPLVDSRGRTLAALNVGTQAQRLPAVELSAKVLPHLLEMQRSLRPILR